MKSIRIGNDIRIEWPLRLSGDIGKLPLLDTITVQVRPSEAIIDWHNYTEHPTLRKETHTVMANVGLCDCEQFDREPFDRPPFDRTPYGHAPHDRTPHDRRPPQPYGRRPERPLPVTLPVHIEGDTLIALWTADRQFDCGEYDIILYARKNRCGQAVADQCRFVRLVPHTAMADLPDGSGIEAVIQLQPLTIQLAGLSAYDIAVANGFTGTEQEWLASLKGGDSQAAADAAKKATEAAQKAEEAIAKAEEAAKKATDAAEAVSKATEGIDERVGDIVDGRLKALIPDGKAIVLVDIDDLPDTDEDAEAEKMGLSPVYSNNVQTAQRVMISDGGSLKGVYVNADE